MMEESGGSIFQTIGRLLPILLIGTIFMGLVLFTASSVVPNWRDYDAANQQLEAANQLIAQQSGSDVADEVTILQHQLDGAGESLQQGASIFMTADQAEGILDSLYTYSHENGVVITSLQAQQAAAPSTTTTNSGRPGRNQTPVPDVVSTTFRISSFRLRVDGKLPQLMGFVSRIREATVSGVLISNLNLMVGDPLDTLVIDILIYSSPFASGESYVDIPPVDIPPQLLMPEQQTVVTVNGTPVVEPLTPEATVTAEPEPPMTLLLSDSFDSGDLSNWNLGANWVLTSDAGGQVLEAKDSSGETTLVYNSLTDSAVQVRVWLDTGGIRLSLRQSAAGRYTVTLDALGLVALYRGGTVVQSSYSNPSGILRWRTLRISAIGGIIRVSVDDAQVIYYEDPVPLPPGTVSLALNGGGVARIDDAQVWVLDTATTEPTPTP